MTDQMSNDNLMTMVLVGLIVYMMLNKKTKVGCGCNEQFSQLTNCSGSTFMSGKKTQCSECNGIDITTGKGKICNLYCGKNCSLN